MELPRSGLEGEEENVEVDIYVSDQSYEEDAAKCSSSYKGSFVFGS